jgi:hypothetical protein
VRITACNCVPDLIHLDQIAFNLLEQRMSRIALASRESYLSASPAQYERKRAELEVYPQGAKWL